MRCRYKVDVKENSRVEGIRNLATHLGKVRCFVTRSNLQEEEWEGDVKARNYYSIPVCIMSLISWTFTFPLDPDVWGSKAISSNLTTTSSNRYVAKAVVINPMFRSLCG